MKHISKAHKNKPPLPYPWFDYKGDELKRVSGGLYSSMFQDMFPNLDAYDHTLRGWLATFPKHHAK